jgi:hypothetical protein
MIEKFSTKLQVDSSIRQPLRKAQHPWVCYRRAVNHFRIHHTGGKLDGRDSSAASFSVPNDARYKEWADKHWKFSREWPNRQGCLPARTELRPCIFLSAFAGRGLGNDELADRLYRAASASFA